VGWGGVWVKGGVGGCEVVGVWLVGGALLFCGFFGFGVLFVLGVWGVVGGGLCVG